MLTLVFVGCSDAEIHIVSETSPEDKSKLIFMPNSVQAAAKELHCVHLQCHGKKLHRQHKEIHVINTRIFLERAQKRDKLNSIPELRGWSKPPEVDGEARHRRAENKL